MASSELRWHPAALAKARDARDWYAERSSSAARAYLWALEHGLISVSSHPRRYRQGPAGCREFVFPNKYPFTLVYRLLEEGLVEIVAVSSQRRKPQYWRDR